MREGPLFVSVVLTVSLVLAGCIDASPGDQLGMDASGAVVELDRDRIYTLESTAVRLGGSLLLQEPFAREVVFGVSMPQDWEAKVTALNASDDARTYPFVVEVTPGDSVEVGTNASLVLEAVANGALIAQREFQVGVAQAYNLSNFLTWDHAHLEILIVPPAHGPIVSLEQGPLPYGPEGVLPGGVYLDATLHVIEDWRWALDRFAENHTELAWVANITWDVRIVSEDVVTPDQIAAADIVKFYTETTYPILGAAANTGGLLGGNGPGCVAYNTKWTTYGSISYMDMYYLAGHELLHCFGMSHPDDMDPVEDIMSYESWPLPEFRCPSNLNVLAAAAAFKNAFPGAEGPASGETAQVPRPAYEQYCPPAGLVEEHA